MLLRFQFAGIILAALILFVPSAKAQDSSAEPKAPSNLPAPEEQTATPDSRPLSGAQDLTVGYPSSSHSFLSPSFGVTTAVQTNPYGATQSNANDFFSTTYLSGRLAVNKLSGRSELLADYLVGGGFSNETNQESSLIQSLDFSETIHWGRWSQLFGDQFTYLPSSSFNFGGLGGLSNFGVNPGAGTASNPGFRRDLLPDQSILTSGGPRVSNAVIAQTGYLLSPRLSLTFLGSYGVLDFTDNGFQNSSSVSARGGLNYLLDPLNSVSISYGFSKLMFSDLPQGVSDHTVQFSFARRITGRLSFQAGAGPDVQLYQAPIAGPSTVVSWAASSALNYQVRHIDAGFNYNHGLTGGSGILLGAETDVFSGKLYRALGPYWQAGLSIGYSRNRILRETAFNGTSTTVQGWFASAQINRRFVRHGNLFISYNASRQSGLANICALPACNTGFLTQTISIGYNWALRPVELE